MGLRLLCLCALKLSNYSSARQAFVRRLQKLLQLMSRNLLHVFISQSGQDFSIVVAEGIMFHKATVQQITGFFL